MQHIEEHTLELYVLDAEEVRLRKREIERHLKECHGCRTLLEKIEAFYRSAERELRSRPQTPRNVRRELIRSNIHIEPFYEKEREPIVRRPTALPARVMIFMRQHPVVSTVSVAAFLLAIALLAYPKRVARDLTPSYARAKDEFLVAYNSKGEELWKKHIGIGYDVRGLGLQGSESEPVLSVVDVDGDGKNEIIAIFGWIIQEKPLSSAVVCYSADGIERWRYEFHRQITFGKETFSDDYRIIQMMVGDFDKDGQYEVVFVAQHGTWPPSSVVRLNARNGTVLGEYWHPGRIKIAHKDIDGDGIEEILVAGYNNAFEKSALAVLDSRRIEGHAPATDEYIPQGVTRSTENGYVLLPNPDLYVSASDWDQGSGVSCDSNGLIEMRSGRILPGNKAGEWVGVVVFFYFDNHLNCAKVKAGDDFTNIHLRMEKEGKLSKRIDAKYLEELRRGVQYWDGEKFVREPTMNKRYLDTAKSKQLP
jgi:hypothetical protein